MNYTFDTKTGDGTTTAFTFGFAGPDEGYIDLRRDLRVFVNGAEVPFTTSFADPNKVFITPAPVAGASILIRRIMPRTSPYSDFKGSNAFTPQQLNNTALQQLYLTQEILDGFYDPDFYLKQDLNMGGHKITNLKPGTGPGEAVNWDQLTAVDKKHTDWNTAQDAEIEAIKIGMVDNVGSRTVPWLHVALGGETSIKPPFKFKSAWVWRDGVMQYQLDGAYQVANNSIIFPALDALRAGEKVLIAMGSTAAAPDDHPTFEEVMDMVSGQVGDLESRLASAAGGSMIGLRRGNLASAMLPNTPQMFGAKADYVLGPWNQPGTGTNDRKAIQDAIDDAILQGKRCVVIPAGSYYIDLSGGPLNLNGSWTTGVVAASAGAIGVQLLGEGIDSTKLYFKFTSADQPAIWMPGGSGVHSSRAICDMTVHPTSDSLYQGCGARLEGACFTMVHRVAFMKLKVGVHLYNSTRAGTFTEFNMLHSNRYHRCGVGLLLEVNGGDNSFHGNDVFLGQFQVKDNRDISGDGNLTPGVGIEMRGTTAPAYWYNALNSIHMFGGPSAVAIKLTNANTDNVIGNITAEGDLIFQSTDATSSFEVRGGVYSIGNVTFNTPAEPTSRASIFVFTNRISNGANFSTSRLPNMRPALYLPELADRTNNGVTAVTFRGVGTNIEAMCYATAGTSTNHHYFGYIPPNSNLQGFIPGIRINYDGGAIFSYANTFYLSNGGTGGVQITDSMFAPREDNTKTLGGPSFRWSVVHAGSGTIVTSDETVKVFRDTPDDIAARERLAAAEIKSGIRAYQLKDAIREKGSNARLHFGVGAQTVVATLRKHGLLPDDYAFVVLSQWDNQEESEESPAVEEGSRYGIRYEELIMFILMNT